MRLLIAIKSCNRDLLNGCHTAIRETWGKDFSTCRPNTVMIGGRLETISPPKGDIVIDVRFFIGNGDAPLKDDEIRLAVEDTLVALPLKVRGIAGWSAAKEYDFTFCCDVDTFVRPDRLIACEFEKYDYFGYFGNARPPGAQIANFDDCRLGKITVWAYASGGAGYFVSRRAAEHLSKMVPSHYAEDVSVGQVLGPLIAANQLRGFASEQFHHFAVWHYCTWGRTSYNWPNSVGFNPIWMYESHKRGEGV